jgi:hypothetical protein
MIRLSSKLAGAGVIALGSLATFAGSAVSAPLSHLPDIRPATDLEPAGRSFHAFGGDAVVIQVQGAGVGYNGPTGFWLRLPGLNLNAPPAGYCGPYGFSAAGLYGCSWIRFQTDPAGGRSWYARSYWGNGYTRSNGRY